MIEKLRGFIGVTPVKEQDCTLRHTLFFALL